MLIDVVIPIFAGLLETRRCIQSVIATREIPGQPDFELILIDDCSREAGIKDFLAEFRGRSGITVLTNEQNRGFVVTANRGMALHADRDLVLLNSDTEVANDWLRRLRDCAFREADIGTATPFSNNATICSFPVCCADNPLPEGLGLAEIDAVFARMNAQQTLEIPTAVGFCMYIRRDCIDAVGLFDEQRFGRGYGEENDFCRRAIGAGWRNVLCADTFVYHQGGASFQSEREALVNQAEPVLRALHPDYFDAVSAFIRCDPAAPFRRAVDIELVRSRIPLQRPLPAGSVAVHSMERVPRTAVAYVCHSPDGLSPAADGKAVQLHVVHDLGGGIERWCRDYCRADSSRTNLVLKPYGRETFAVEGLMLFAALDDPEPIALWVFTAPFDVTAATHPEYAQAVREIIETYRVDALLVSSPIWHTLHILTTGLPTAFIAHDFFPACPAIHLHFGAVCGHCNDARLVECAEKNLDFNPFALYSGAQRLAVRHRFLEILDSRQVTVVVPSRSVWRHLLSLFPELHTASWVHIPHGDDSRLSSIDFGKTVAVEKLRIVVLGMLSVSKGVRLLAAALDQLTQFAEVHLVGAQEVGELFIDRPGVHVVTRYELGELQDIVQGIRPDVGLLMSIWPETYSYTLTELMRMGVPPIATRLGGFAERIIEGDTGYLIEATPEALLARMRELDADRASLARVRENLTSLTYRNGAAMVADYHRLLPISQPKGMARTDSAACTSPADSIAMLGIRQAMALSTMRKQITSLDLQLSMSREARPRLQSPDQIAEIQRRTSERLREVAEHQREVAEAQRAIAEHQRALSEQQRALAAQQHAAAEVQFNDQRQRWLERANESARVLLEREKALSDKQEHIQQLSAHLVTKDKEIEAILTSTSWRLSRPLRMLGNVVRRTRLMFHCLLPILRDPAIWPKTAAQLLRAWQSGGLLQVKQALLRRADVGNQDSWTAYRATFEESVKPRIIQAIAGMTDRPLISIIVPTYNTRKLMLRQMIESVRAQLYPNWELCIVDDCSSESHVRKILKEYAKDDARIKLHFGTENRGVSHVSNRALELVNGEFVVLLDHDDVLEEQALFRVAQSLLTERPDLLYSDEIMVSEDLETALQFAHRPAFSPEFLRSHPYIVHMVGFRPQLLRDIGGFDESLKISQDYDLILRAVEKSATVVHIPEFLYRWRIHGGSAGKQKMDAVMQTSKAVLQRHLQRCGEVGSVDDGAGFNLFDTRYQLQPGLRVAIIIPTKNHGELVRQCVDSLRVTIGKVAYSIVIVDHESTEPETLSYLSSISSDVQILRYSGRFNFSAINNWAVSQLSGEYSHYLFCNNDIEATQPGWLERMLELGQHPDVGAVGAQLLYPDRVTIQHAGVCVGAFGAAEHYAKFVRLSDIPRYLGFSEIVRSNHEVSAVTAACLLMRKDAFDEVAGFDEKLAVGFGDVDLCLRVVQRGYRILQCPHAELVHHESFTRGKTTGIDPHPEDSALFQSRWAAFLHAGDPYFHPGLHQNSTAWQMRNPMRCGFDVRRRVYRRDPGSGRQSFDHSVSDRIGPAGA